MPPLWLTWSMTACIAYFISPRNDAPGPLATIVVARLMRSPVTPRSVEPPFAPPRHWNFDGATTVVAVPPPFLPPTVVTGPADAPGATGPLVAPGTLVPSAVVPGAPAIALVAFLAGT